ncbi:PR-1-like protein [Hypomontagnella monticulosa]|nr:PR-1-like protein [Hypomontagnella monticulosa]
MKSSMMVVAGAAALAMGSPLEKRKMETSWVMEYYTVTVTGTESAKPTLFWGQKHRPDSTSNPVVIVTVTPEAPAPEPTSQQPTVVVVTETASAAPQPTPVEQAPAASSSAAAAPSASGDDYASVAVQHHNLHRSNHSSPEVTWSDKLAGYALATASKCVMAHDMDQGDKGYGQNLANWAQNIDAYKLGDIGALKMAVTDFWYNGEFRNFRDNFYGEATPDMTDFESWGHFSQMLWKSSTEVGCAAYFCEKGTMYSEFDAWFTVCNYSPPGNVGGAYGTNVFKGLGKQVETA